MQNILRRALTKPMSLIMAKDKRIYPKTITSFQKQKSPKMILITLESEAPKIICLSSLKVQCILGQYFLRSFLEIILQDAHFKNPAMFAFQFNFNNKPAKSSLFGKKKAKFRTNAFTQREIQKWYHSSGS